MKETVKVLGRHITVRSESEDPRYVHEVAAHVNRIGERLMKEIPGVKPEQLALMVALELADESFQKSEALDARNTPDRRIGRLIEKIAKALS